MNLNDLINQNQFVADEKAQLSTVLTQMKTDDQAFMQGCADQAVQFSVEFTKGQIDKDGYTARMQDLQRQIQVQADAQAITVQIKWQAFANQLIDVVAKIVLSKIGVL